METDEAIFDGDVYGLYMTAECKFQRIMDFVVLLKEMQEIERIGGVECTMFEMQEGSQVAFVVIAHEIVRCIVHQCGQFQAFADNGFPLPPGQYCGPETHDFDILLDRKPVWYADWVKRDEIRLVVLRYLPVEQLRYVRWWVGGLINVWHGYLRTGKPARVKYLRKSSQSRKKGM